VAESTEKHHLGLEQGNFSWDAYDDVSILVDTVVKKIRGVAASATGSIDTLTGKGRRIRVPSSQRKVKDWE